MGDAADDIAYLFRSDARLDTLTLVQNHGPCPREAVLTAGNRSRRTNKRTLDGLEARGFVVVTDGRVDLTVLGQCVLDSCHRMQERLGVAGDLAPVLERVRASEFGLTPETLAEAQVVVATESSPYAPVDRVLSLRRGSSDLRDLSSIVLKESVDQLWNRVQGGDAPDVDIVLEQAVVDAASNNPDYRDTFEDILAAPSVSISVHDGSFPFLLTIADEAVAVGVTERTQPHALLVSDAPAVREWAEDVFREYSAGAERIDP